MFNAFDLDSSGDIDRTEFRALLATLLQVDAQYLSENRIARFWSEAHTNNCKGINFPSFLVWVLMCFRDRIDSDDFSPATLSTALYGSFGSRGSLKVGELPSR